MQQDKAEAIQSAEKLAESSEEGTAPAIPAEQSPFVAQAELAVSPQACQSISAPLQGSFLPAFTASRRQRLLALLTLAVALLFFRAQALPVFFTHYLGGAERDAGLYLWLLQRHWSLAELLPGSARLFDLGAFYPYGSSLAYSDNYLLPTLFYRLLLALTQAPIVSANVLLLAASLCSGYCTYLFCFRLCARHAAAIFAALLFMGYSFLSLHLGHPQLQHTFWLPLCFLQLLRALSARSYFQFFLFGLALAGCFLTTVYYAVFIGMLALAFCGLCALARPDYFRSWQLFGFGAAASLGLGCGLPWILPYLGVRKVFGARALYESHSFAPTSLSFLAAPPHSALYSFSSALSGVDFSLNPEAMLFPGFVLLLTSLLGLRYSLSCPRSRRLRLALYFSLVALALFSSRALPLLSDAWQCTLASFFCWASLGLGLCCLWRLAQSEKALGYTILTNRDLGLIFALLALLCFVLALGPLADEGSPQPSFSPFRVAYALLPGFDALRAVGRIGTFWCFCLCVASALWLARALRTGRSSLWLCVLFTIVAAFENLHLDYPRESELPAPSAIRHLQVLGRQASAPLPAVSIVLPLTSKTTRDGRVMSWADYAFFNIRALRWSAVSADAALVNGYSGQRPKLQTELVRRLRSFPDSASLRALRQIAGLRYVVVLPQQKEIQDPAAYEQRLKLHAQQITALYQGPDGSQLLELRGSQLLDSQFVLYVPPRRGEILELALVLRSTQENVPTAGARLGVLLEEGKILRSIREERLEPGSKRHVLQLLLTDELVTDLVRPLRLRFALPEGLQVELESSRVLPP
jgi:hypothetical protein